MTEGKSSRIGNIEKYEATIEELEAKIRNLKNRKYAPDPAMDAIERLCNKRDLLQNELETLRQYHMKWRDEMVFIISTMDERGRRNEEGNSYMLWEDYWQNVRGAALLVMNEIDKISRG